VIVGDGNFGIFSFAYEAVQSGHQVLFRLSKTRAKALGAAALLPNGECKLVLRPSKEDRRNHRQWPAEAQLEGRLVVVTQNGFREPLYLFTTLSVEKEKIVAWYAKRWDMELDLRSLKGPLRIRHLNGKSTAAIEKELLIAVVVYGLVRAFMALAAQRAGVPPRRLSFTRAYGLLNAMIDKLCVSDARAREQGYDRILQYMSQAKLPQRSKRREYPREIWGSGKSYPKRKLKNGGLK
jgi:hypothetical protein